MLSQTNVHRLAVNTLDRLTAHIRCLRIIDMGGFNRFMPQVKGDEGWVNSRLQQVHGGRVPPMS